MTPSYPENGEHIVKLRSRAFDMLVALVALVLPLAGLPERYRTATCCDEGVSTRGRTTREPQTRGAGTGPVPEAAELAMCLAISMLNARHRS